MTPLTPAEITAAKSIAAALVGHPPRTIARAYEASLNHMLARLLTAGWKLAAAGDHAVLFGDAVLRAVDEAKAKKALH